MNYKQEFIKQLNAIVYHQDIREIFYDFLHMSAYAISGKFHAGDEFDWLFNNAKKVFSKYKESDLQKFDSCFNIMVQSMEAGYSDFLGEIYMEINISNSNTGQFFTPYCVSQMMSKIVYSESVIKLLERKPFVKVHEPACGSGGMVIALAEEMKSRDINYATSMFVVAIDIDEKCFLMSYIQLSLFDIPAKIIHGDTLRLSLYKYLFTPAVFLHQWEMRLTLVDLLKFDKHISTQTKSEEQQIIKHTDYDFELQPIDFGEVV